MTIHNFCICNDARDKSKLGLMFGVLVGKGKTNAGWVNLQVFVPESYAKSPWTNAEAVSLALNGWHYHQVTLSLKAFGLMKKFTTKPPDDTSALPPGYVSGIWQQKNE